MTDRKHMVEADEALIVIDEYDGKRFIRETAFFGEFGNFDFIIHYLLDETVEIRRINATTWAEAEDITDECAHHRLMEADAEYALDYNDRDQCESVMPMYVKRLRAWARWMDDQQAEKPVDAVKEYVTLSVRNGHVD